jgi:hypothetical protein
MTVHQMVCHLIDGFHMGTGEKDVSHVDRPATRTILKWYALYVPLSWPSGFPTRPELDQQRGGTRPTDFATDVARLETLLESVTAHGRSVEWRPHPLFGPMSEAAWLRWGYLHVDHHLRQFGA